MRRFRYLALVCFIQYVAVSKLCQAQKSKPVTDPITLQFIQKRASEFLTAVRDMPNSISMERAKALLASLPADKRKALYETNSLTFKECTAYQFIEINNVLRPSRYSIRCEPYGFDIDANTGTIVNFGGSTYFRLPAMPLSELPFETIQRIGNEYCKRAKVDLKDYSGPECKEVDEGKIIENGSNSWQLTYTRYYKHIPYYGQRLILAIDSKTGFLYTLQGRVSSKLPPVSSVPKVSRFQAQSIVNKMSNSNGSAHLEQDSCQLAWVNFDESEILNSTGQKVKGIGLTWVFSYENVFDGDYSNGHIYRYLDAHSGKLVGTHSSMAKCSHPVYHETSNFTNAFVNATGVSVSSNISPSLTRSLSPATLQFFGVVQHINRKPMADVEFTATHTIIVSRNDGYDEAVEYDQRHDILRDKNGQIRLASSEMAKWVASLSNVAVKKVPVLAADLSIPCGFR